MTMDTRQPMVPIPNDEFIKRSREFQKELREKILKLSRQKTPKYDQKGNQIIKKRKDSYEYPIETYMRDGLDKHFPGWSWVEASPLQLLGSEWVVISGCLEIIEPILLYMGTYPPIRRFYSPSATRIQYGEGKPHTVEYLVNLDNDVGTANSRGFKRAVNRLCRIADDVYRKHIETGDEWEGDAEAVILTGTGNLTLLKEVLKKYEISWSLANAVPGFDDLIEQCDYEGAYQLLVNKGLI